MNNLKKIAIVTGASKGIGLAISKDLLKQGYVVVGLCRNLVPEVLNSWCGIGGCEDLLLKVDITDTKAIANMLSHDVFLDGKIEVLINNAGITADSFFHKMTYEQWTSVIDTNLKAIFNVTQAVYIKMMEHKFGRIINVSSVNGQKGQAGQTNYSAAKAGVHGFTKALAQEACRHNITVNTVSPGYTETSMITAIKPEILESIKSSIPLKRFASPDEIANTVTFLASDAAAYITGADISINGGLFIS